MGSDPGLSTGVLVWAVAALALASVGFSVLSALLERSGPIRLRHWAEEAGGSLRALYDSSIRFGVFRYFLSLSARVAPVALALLAHALCERLGAAYPLTTALLSILVLLAAVEVLNRALVGRDPERALSAVTGVYRVLLFVLSPVIAPLAHFVPEPLRSRREEGEENEASDEEIEAFIDVGTREGILEPEQGELLWSIVDFADTQVRSVMTPRMDMVCAPVDASLEALAERFIESGHSRIPLFEESIDRIVGVLHIREVLRAQKCSDPPAVRELVKPPLFVAETKELGELLKELQKRFQQVAIVVDEYGGTAGLVTIEDLVEEIVGEIMDEHEALAADLEPVEEGVFRLDGRAHIEILDELFGVEIEDPEYETVAGLIFSSLGHVPRVGETVEHDGLLFTVEAVAARRIEKVRVERLHAAAEAREEGG